MVALATAACGSSKAEIDAAKDFGEYPLLWAGEEFEARAPIWKRRAIRGAPVGTIDSAPVLFSRRVQVKAYRGEGSERELAWRALVALRSANKVPPIVRSTGPIPAPAEEVLAGSRRCAA
ncbi:MAG TPA: hypothetical protein VE693_10600 [Gaiellaceae bacterium]|jgi:hypothetical protein|nr:hypothetical protein [Gaiellaceae bacterium]